VNICAIIAAAVLPGPYPLLVTPWTADAKLDIPTLVKEAGYVNAQGVGGIIWPTAGEVLDNLTDDEYASGLAALAKASVEHKFSARVTAICPGKTSAAAVEHVKTVEKIARDAGATMAILARPPDDATNQVMILDHYREVGKATTLPVIIQTFNGKSPQPDVDLIVQLAREYPEVFGYVKEESPGLKVNDRMEELLSHKEIKMVFSGWGGKGWAYQGPRIGTRGVISQRPAYASLFVRIWNRIAAGADSSDPELADAYTKYLFMANLGDVFSKEGDDDMRGPHLYVLQKLGVFANRLTRQRDGKGGFRMESWDPSDKVKAEIEGRIKYCGLMRSDACRPSH
jgi:dihydrodipicolinate synthase/N-acetylneuraminate lyase